MLVITLLDLLWVIKFSVSDPRMVYLQHLWHSNRLIYHLVCRVKSYYKLAIIWWELKSFKPLERFKGFSKKVVRKGTKLCCKLYTLTHIMWTVQVGLEKERIIYIYFFLITLLTLLWSEFKLFQGLQTDFHRLCMWPIQSDVTLYCKGRWSLCRLWGCNICYLGLYTFSAYLRTKVCNSRFSILLEVVKTCGKACLSESS